jgi:hypothetical protein
MKKLLRKKEQVGSGDTAAHKAPQELPRLDGLWTPKQVAATANYQSEVSVLRAFRRRELPGYKLNARTVRFHPEDVAKWLAAARVS